MDMRFQAIIEAAVQQAKAEQSLLWAEEIAERIVSSTPLVGALRRHLRADLPRGGATGRAVTVMQRQSAPRNDGLRPVAA